MGIHGLVGVRSLLCASFASAGLIVRWVRRWVRQWVLWWVLWWVLGSVVV
jgi:hypothetical protein